MANVTPHDRHLDQELPADPETGPRPEAGPGPEAADVFRARPPVRRRARALAILAVIGLGGGIGSSARYLLAHAVPTPPDGFPWATFVTNVSGCFLLGALMVFVLDVWPPSRYVRPFFGVGVLGGFTTFSTFTGEIVHLAQDGRWAVADSYALDSLIAGLVAVWCGMALARVVAGIPSRRARESKERS